MWQRIRRLWTAPTFDALAGGEGEGQRAELLQSLVLIHAALMCVMVFVAFVTPAPLVAVSAVGSLLVVDVVVLYLNRRGEISLSAGLFTASLWLVIAILTVFLGGVYGVAFSAYLVVVAVAGFLLGGRGAVAIAALSVVVGLGVAWAQENNSLPVPLGESTPLFMWLALAVYILIMVAIVRLATRSLYAALARARQSEQSLTSNLGQLEESRDALNAQARILERQTAQLRAAAEISRSVVSILDLEDLLWQAAGLLAHRFDLYHVGIFQLDSTGSWAEYRAGAGASGRLLADKEFRLMVGGDSLVGACTARSEARIVQDVGAGELGRVEHPLVPDTRSEAALPLIARGRVIGALSLQSHRSNAFDQDTVVVLQTIADQIAVAMDTARLFASSQQALEAARRAYGESTGQAWTDLLRARGGWGYRYEGSDVTPLEREGAAARRSDTTAPGVEIPLTIRDRVVGVLSFQKDPGQPGSQGEAPDAEARGAVWTAEETRFLERLVEQTALAVDSARLYQDTQRLAAQERLLADVTARMRETLDMDTVLRTALSEIGRSLDLAEVEVRMSTEQGDRTVGRAATGSNGDEVRGVLGSAGGGSEGDPA